MLTASQPTTDAERLRRLHHQLLRIRLVEERIAELYPQQEMRCPVHLSIGQEAVAVGVCSALTEQDWVMSGHRSHAHYLAKGGDLKAMLAELYGKAAGCAGGHCGSMHLLDQSVGFLGSVPIVGSTIPIAAGAAWGARLRGEVRVVAVFFGDAAVEEGAFHETLNFAQLKKLPVLFVCENNFYSVHSPLSVRQPIGRDIFRVAEGHGVHSRRGDGNNVLEVRDLARAAVDRARAGEGPTFLEFTTYRWREHCGPYDDHDLGYRSESEILAWKDKCPIRQFEARLVQQLVIDPDAIQATHAAIGKEIDEAVDFAKAAPFPEASALGRYTYAD